MDKEAWNRKYGRSTILGKEMFLDEIVHAKSMFINLIYRRRALGLSEWSVPVDRT